MIRKTLIFIFLASFLFTSCNDNVGIQVKDSEYLMFGHFFGECGGERCIEIFKLKEGSLYEDLRDKYPSPDHFYEGDFVQLSQQQYESVKDLLDYFPKDLLKEIDTVIGQPDAGDWGGLYVEYNVNGVRKFWLIDRLNENVPEKYHLFIDKIKEKVELLK